MTVVVTGASGFVGGNLARALVAEGCHVRVPIHSEDERRWLDGLDVEIVPGDVRDPDSLRRAFAGAEIVYHLAGVITLLLTEWPRVKAVNVEGTRHVVQVCLENKVRRLVHFSSFHALVQRPLDRPLTEDARRTTAWFYPPYDRSKSWGERAVRDGIAAGLDAVIVNPTGVIGPHDYRPSYFGSVLRDLAQSRLPFLVGGGCDWVDVRDVVAGAQAAAN
ncbi:MAG: SDR family NAD(P)-dependent oxidoreductase, partial [Anaerolineae bacterium]|nr:SDR family NAD(P)-dependent oxidoreductase [Anaerolineae bacterium]